MALNTWADAGGPVTGALWGSDVVGVSSTAVSTTMAASASVRKATGQSGLVRARSGIVLE